MKNKFNAVGYGARLAAATTMAIAMTAATDASAEDTIKIGALLIDSGPSARSVQVLSFSFRSLAIARRKPAVTDRRSSSAPRDNASPQRHQPERHRRFARARRPSSRSRALQDFREAVLSA